MNAFVCFVLVTVAYAAAMAFFGRTLRARGHGSKLDTLRDMHQKIQGWLRASVPGRATRRRPSSTSSTDDSSE